MPPVSRPVLSEALRSARGRIDRARDRTLPAAGSFTTRSKTLPTSSTPRSRCRVSQGEKGAATHRGAKGRPPAVICSWV